jgi:hypothetical protein
MRSLGWKLGGALVLVALIAIGLMAFLTNLNTTSQFRSYMQSGNMMHFQNVASELGQYYSTNGSWKGVDVRLKDSIRMSGDRLVLADVNGQIVGDTANQWQGLTAESLTLSGVQFRAQLRYVIYIYLFRQRLHGRTRDDGQ